jgi:protein-disulfide isomerase
MPKKKAFKLPSTPSTPRPIERRAPRQYRRATARRRRWRPRSRSWSWQWGLVLAVVVVGGIVGVAVQASRSPTENLQVVIPKGPMGPNGSVIVGQPAAKVLVEEYGDFQCPVCKAFHDSVEATIQNLLNAGTIRFAFHPLNVIDSHSPGSTESLRAASASLCANDAGEFWNYYNLLYNKQAATENSGFLTDSRLVAFGSQAGITGNAFSVFQRCVTNHTYEGYVLKYADQASRPPANVTGTPTIFIDGKLIDNNSLANAAGTAFDPSKLVAAVQQAAAG